ncbi:hypothetical protein F2Q68_00027578 [Brassica cretica]|uniref:BED-type domain-containing protein n=1 Tax=Brassica cretica TaxID=69181 RepID=A0A8S9I8B4_BRACR|nr:hypothetical protein F2Q68_00027578 [Brassica cretica]
MANAWKRDKNQKLLAPKTLIITLLVLSIIFLSSLFFSSSSSSYLQNTNPNPTISTKFPIPPFDCFKCPQSKPVIANVVENLKYPFLYSLADLGNLPEKPHKNIVRLLKGKPFRKPDISATIQEVLERMSADGKRDGFVVDVGANVGMASFAAAAMGFKVLAFEPVFENLQRICDGIWFNRVASLVTVFEAAASDRNGDITFHKCYGLETALIMHKSWLEGLTTARFRRWEQDLHSRESFIGVMDESNEIILQKSKRLTSIVWNYFERVRKADVCYAVCIQCNKKLSGSSNSGTTHLRNHLMCCLKRTNHDSVYVST